MSALIPFDLETERLRIRPFVLEDLDAIAPILDEGFGHSPLDERRQWLEWSLRNYAALAQMYQPPYGDYAIVLKGDNLLIGAVGYVPSYGPFGKLPYFRARSTEPVSELFTPEMGLFWAVGGAYRGQGYASEAAGALIRHAFEAMSLKRIVATTEYNNAASIAVMRRVGMIIERNPDPAPPWFQIVGILENPALRG
ncbi:MAG: GNAT family N-acetyltransferase [Anaerolineae bacterium]|nr:GNAT family N-acetyltransferase [Anaerolineae bacterium]